MSASAVLSQNSVRPWPWFSDNGHSDDLCSLAMIRYRVENLFALLCQCKSMEAEFADKSVLIPDTGPTGEQREKLLQLLMNGDPNFLAEASELDMLDSPTFVTNFYERVKASAPSYTLKSAESELRSLREHFEFQLDSRLFLFVSLEQAKHYKNTNALTKKAREAFLSAYMELIEAGNCYAASNNNACVFHAMRSLEQPIRAIAKAIKAPLHKDPKLANWGDFDRAIATHVSRLKQSKHTRKRDEQLQFYSEIGIQFGYLTLAFRNFVCHGRAEYDEHQAASVLEHAIAFVERLVKEGLAE